MQNLLSVFTNNKDKEINNKTPQETSVPVKVNPFKPRNKEITENVKEVEKIKIFGENKNFKFDFKVFGRSIFQNLILTTSAYVEISGEREAIPIKCIWRRIKRDIAVYIKDVNSNSYIPTAEDIGYIIEVEATPVDTSIYGNDSAFGQYGPITLDDDMKSTIELLLTSGGTKFSCYIFDLKEQEKITDREIIVYINPNEFKLVETDYNGKEKILECLKYHQFNPIIKLHPYDSYRFSLKIFEYCFNDTENMNGAILSDKLNEIPKSEYHLIAMSKQCRELIYLLIHFFLIDEKLKNSKLFSVVNYNLLPQETKVGVTDLIAEIKTLREENNVYMNNMKILEKMNKDIKEEMRNLEEDFQITLESINQNSFTIEQDIEKNKTGKLSNNLQQFTQSTPRTMYVNNTLNNTSNFFDLKKKYDELRETNSSLLSKEKALREENKELVLNVEILKNNCNELTFENKKLRADLFDKEQEMVAIKKSLNLISETKNKLQSNYETLLEENKILKTFKDENSQLIEKSKNINEDEINNLKNKISEIQKQNETLTYENKNLMLQRNLLTNQKDAIAKEFDKLKKEKSLQDETFNNFSEEIENLKSILTEKENVYLDINNTVEKYKKDNTELKTKYELLEIEHSAVKESYNTMFMNLNSGRQPMQMMNDDENCIKITQEEYEEYDTLKKEKDEIDAVIMQLKTNSEAKDLEIKNLKMLIENFKK
jgi:hypothetical protein